MVTSHGRKTAGDNLADLAWAMWQEIHAIEDQKTRDLVIAGTIRRLARNYASKIVGDSIQERLQSAARLFSERDVPIVVEENEGRAVLRILACPYPNLENENHQCCDMEQRLISQVVGGRVDLCECHRHGDGSCSYQALTETN
jgi:predicted ArsR family transcriptional regulator